jgi:hypothetical protein
VANPDGWNFTTVDGAIHRRQTERQRRRRFRYFDWSTSLQYLLACDLRQAAIARLCRL